MVDGDNYEAEEDYELAKDMFDDENDVMDSVYTSKQRDIEDRLEGLKVLYITGLKSEAAEVVIKYIQDIISLNTMIEQICFVVDFLRPNGNNSPLASFSQIGTMFHLSKGVISSHYKRGLKYRQTGRDNCLFDEQINEVIRFAYDAFSRNAPATFEDILHFVKERFGISLMIKTLYKPIGQIPQLKSLSGIPMESERINCDIHMIDQYYDDLEEVLKLGIPSAFIINIDEAGYSEWVNARNVKVIVPPEYENNEIKIPISRNPKRSSMVVGICADGTSIKPGVAIPRKKVELELVENGYTPDKISITYQENGFYDTDAFMQWVYEQLLPDIRTKRQVHNYQGEALIIFDGFGPHDYDDFFDICTDERIIVLPLPAHASDQCQPLKLGIFAVQKGKMPRISVDTKLNAQTIQLIRMIDSFTEAASISNVFKAFKIGGIVSHYDIKEKKLFPSVDRTCATRVRHCAYTQNECVNKKRMDVSKFRFADDVVDGDYEEPICSSQKDRTFTCKRIRKS